jgi:DNA-binding LacI/PurR family transcriptional regulator
MAQPVTALRGRPPEKREQVVSHVRRLIVEGRLKPGDRVPGQVGLKNRFGATATTVEQAMGRLQLQGFVEMQRRRGTFVAPHPPHVSQYALAFPWGESHAPSQFYKAIRKEAEKLQRPERRLSPYFNLDGVADSQDYRALAAQITDHCLAGLIFAYHPHHLIGWPILETKGLPRVAIISSPNFPGIPAVGTDGDDFLDKALDCVVARGRRRVAAITLAHNAGGQDEFAGRFAAAVSARGLVSHPWWVQGASFETPRWAGNAAQVLMSAAPKERPDALLIMDDNLVEHATAGLAAYGVRVPSDVEVIAHTNFPWPTPSAMPVTRLGFDIGKLVAICLERIDQQRCGEATPELTLIPALFEEELASVTHPSVAGGKRVLGLGVKQQRERQAEGVQS